MRCITRPVSHRLPSVERPLQTVDRHEASQSARDLYFDLLNHFEKTDARDFLDQHLGAAARLHCELPEDLSAIGPWIDRNTQAVGERYRSYLDNRKAGGARRYFRSRSHALFVLQAIAPTKLVDGAWLYGFLPHWQDGRYREFIRIYLEELGEGLPDKNHVVLYRQLLASHQLDHWRHLDDRYFVQGTIQLALARHAEQYLPEIIGYNLGYEQLPLHLLISAYELNELGLDPYYFTLHVTVDNADTGHARSAYQGLLDALPKIHTDDAFMERVRTGFRLNDVGVGTLSVIADFDLERELVQSLQRKCKVGHLVHSDFCRVEGRTVNAWLSNPQDVPAFLAALEGRGWIRRGEPPEQSRFWNLIQGPRSEMFGVFSPYEQQLIQDWISGDLAEQPTINRPTAGHQPANGQRPASASYRMRSRQHNRTRQASPTANRERPLFRGEHAEPTDFTQELYTLEKELAAISDRKTLMRRLGQLMAPHSHHTAAGLMATRLFTELFNQPN